MSQLNLLPLSILLWYSPMLPLRFLKMPRVPVEKHLEKNANFQAVEINIINAVYVM